MGTAGMWSECDRSARSAALAADVPTRPFREVGVWAVILACLTVSGAVWLNLQHLDYEDFSPAIVLIGYSPALAAIVTMAVLSGRRGVRLLLSEFGRWRAGVGWYLLAALGPLAVVLLVTGVVTLLGGASTAHWLVLPGLATVGSLVGPIIAGSLGEELGWRGFAQPRLQMRILALPAAVLVGLAWSGWHLWPLLTPSGSRASTAVDVTETIIRLVSTAVIYAWLYNSSGHSLPVVMVAHAGHNIAIDLLAPDVVASATGSMVIALVYAFAAGVVVALTGPLTLTRSD